MTQERMTTDSRRVAIAHIHLFKNAGTSVERWLQQQFGTSWISYDKPGSAQRLLQHELETFLDAHPGVAAVSSHQLRPPIESNAQNLILPLVMVRHPIDRIRSAYDFERTQGGVSPSSEMAERATFAKWVEWHHSRGSTQCENFQTYGLTTARSDLNGAPLRKLGIRFHSGAAIEFLEGLPVIGVVESFDRSVQAFARWFGAYFDGLAPESHRVNVRSTDSALADRLSDVESRLGSALYEELLERNAADFELHNYARWRLKSQT